jgi:hypothetical protein
LVDLVGEDVLAPALRFLAITRHKGGAG